MEEVGLDWQSWEVCRRLSRQLQCCTGGRLVSTEFLKQSAVTIFLSPRFICPPFDQMEERKICVKVASQKAVPLPKTLPGKVQTVRCNQHLAGNSCRLKWREELPCVLVNLGELSRNVKKLVANHGGSIPLASLPHCYALQFPPLLAVPGEEGVPLEHLLQAIKDVAITTGVNSIKRLANASTGLKEFHCSELIGPPPSLANQLITFSKEVVDLLRAAPACRLPLYKFIPSYQLMFGKQCRVEDYGYTKLNDLLDSLPHVVQTHLARHPGGEVHQRLTQGVEAAAREAGFTLSSARCVQELFPKKL